MRNGARSTSLRLALDTCAFCDEETWCYGTNDVPTCRGCHVVAYFAAVLFEPIGLRLLPWQEKFLREVYGTVDLDTGRRQFWKAYAEVPGKNGKSFLIGGLPLYHMDAEGVERAQAFGCAAAKEQAGIVYRSAAHLVRENPDPDFRRRFKINESTFRIIHRPTSGYYRVISADGKLNDGEEPSLAIFDELHRWSTHKAQTLYHVMNKGTVSRLDSMIIEITTAGGKDESPICWAEHERARRILAGAEPHGKMYAVIYGADEERHKKEPDYWQSREARVQANPSHEDNGGFLHDDKIVEQMQALGKAPYLRYHLNLWAQKQDRWLESGEWERGAIPLRAL